MIKTKNQLAVERLGRYFGVVTAHTNTAALLAQKQFEGLPISTKNIPLTFEESNPVVQALVEVTEGGILTCDMIDMYTKFNSGQSDEDSLTSAEEVRKMLRLTYDGYDDSSADDLCPILHDKDKIDDQGTGLPEGKKVYSINRMLGIAESATGEENAPSVNAKPTVPDKANPAMSIYQVFPVNFNVSSRDTGSIQLFLNCIPTLEMSRCVPVLDVQVISKTTPLAEDTQNKYGRIQALSIGQFLLGNAAVKVGSANYTMAGSVDAETLTEYISGQDTEEPGSIAAVEQEAKKMAAPGISSAGMELFTAPQTLVMGDEIHYEYDDPAWQDQNTKIEGNEDLRLTAGGKRAAPIIDRFRPFMTLGNFSINVAPSTGMMAYKSASLKITLHDRSRLSEIAPLVKPDMFGMVQLLIEYGWAHPDNAIHAEGVRDPGSPFGWFLGSLRCKEKYQVVNSSFSFTEEGQVEIDLKLAMIGGNDMHTVNIGRGGGVEEQIDVVNKLTNAIGLLRKKISGGGGGSSQTKGFDFLGAASSTSRAVALDKDTMKKIKKFIQTNKGKDSSSDIGQLKDSLVTLYGPKANGKGGALAELKDTIQNEVQRKMKLLKTTEDPFLRDLETKDLKIDKDKKRRRYVSLGKIFSVFLGLPIASTGKYDEVQFVFYSFNAKASYMKDYNIAQFPIPIDDFETMFKEETKTTANPPLRKFMSFLNSSFLSFPGAPGYGMTKIYSKRDKEDKKKAKVAKKFEDETKLFNKKQEVLMHAYGEAGTQQFKKPQLQVRVECVPQRPDPSQAADGDESDPGSKPVASSRSLLRIHIYDSQSTSYETVGQLLEAATKDAIGVISKDAAKVVQKDAANPGHEKQFTDQLQSAIDDGLLEALPINAGATAGTLNVEEFPQPNFRIKGGFPALKKWVSTTMPSLIYGSSASGVIRAQLKSINNPQLATINMQRQGFGSPQDPQGSRDAGVPMRISPTELTLETFGCPLFNFGQQFFIDFGTGTSADNVYAVTGIDHSLAPGEFKTNVKMIQLDTYGKYEGLMGNIQKALTVIADNDAKEDE